MPDDKRYTVEAYWDCQYCGRTGIRGRFTSCPGCGHGRDASVRFYTKETDEAHAISRDEFQRQQAEASKNSKSDSANYTSAHTTDGPSLYDQVTGEEHGGEHAAADLSDWYCDYCDSYNPASAKFCSNCGAAREQSSGKTYRQTMGAVARTYDSKGNLVSERDLSKRKESPKPKQQPRRSLGSILKMVGLGVLALLLVSCIVSLFVPDTRTITVESFDWERTITVEKFKTVSESDWTLPSGARLDHKTSEIRDYEQVLDHYEEVPYQVSEQVLDHYETYTTQVDNGDGTFDVEEHSKPVYRTEHHTEYRNEPVYVSVPIYDTKYYYEVEKWAHERDVVTSGQDHEPKWGEVTLAKASTPDGLGEEREGARTGTYGVTDSKGNHFTADEEFWESLEIGQQIEVLVEDGHISPK